MVLMFFRGVKEGFKQFSDTLQWLVNVVLLSLVYFIGVGIVSFQTKLTKKKLLLLKHEKDKKTYYHELMLTTKQKQEYYRQF